VSYALKKNKKLKKKRKKKRKEKKEEGHHLGRFGPWGGHPKGQRATKKIKK
jgi:hypothetical protein